MAERVSILVVEDERDTSDMLAAYFESQGFQVMQAAWGQDALHMAAQTVPDLILLDIRLPDMDGYEVCRQMRQQRRTQDTPIIFLTERRERMDKLQGLELGAVDYITKPFDIQELRLRVRNALRRANFETLTDPVTSLPSEPLVRDRLNAMLKKHDWAVLSVDIKGAEGFGDAYGFVARDDALRAVALLTNHSVNEGQADPDKSFVGQLSDNSFIIIVEARARLRNCASGWQRASSSRLILFYPAKEQMPCAGERPLAPDVCAGLDHF